MSLFTIQNVQGNWMWPALAVSYFISEYSDGLIPQKFIVLPQISP